MGVAIYPIFEQLPPTKSNQTFEKSCGVFASLWLLLAAVHGQKADSPARAGESSTQSSDTTLGFLARNNFRFARDPFPIPNSSLAGGIAKGRLMRRQGIGGPGY